jgi:hypothetical protein
MGSGIGGQVVEQQPLAGRQALIGGVERARAKKSDQKLLGAEVVGQDEKA